MKTILIQPRRKISLDKPYFRQKDNYQKDERRIKRNSINRINLNRSKA